MNGTQDINIHSSGKDRRPGDPGLYRNPCIHQDLRPSHSTEFNLRSREMRQDDECSNPALGKVQMTANSEHLDLTRRLSRNTLGKLPSLFPGRTAFFQVKHLRIKEKCRLYDVPLSIVSMNYGGIWLSDSTGIISKAVKIASYRDYFYDAILTCLIMNPSYLRYKDSCRTA
jgi:hypothetical protein